MQASSSVRLVVGTIAAVIFLVAVASWDHYVTPAPGMECWDEPAAAGLIPDRPCALVHYIHEPTLVEIAIRIALGVLAMVGVAVLAAKSISKRQILFGALAAVLSTTLAFAVLLSLASRSIEINFTKAAASAAILAVVSLLLGAVSSWAAVNRWPNKSLERTRAE